MLSSPLPCMGCGILMNLSDPARPRFTVHQYASMNSYEFIAPKKKQLLPDISGYLRRFKACFFCAGCLPGARVLPAIFLASDRAQRGRARFGFGIAGKDQP